MERNGRPRRRPDAPSAPTTLTEITRRYYACAVALARAMGVPMAETFMREHRESISCCFIEAGRAGGSPRGSSSRPSPRHQPTPPTARAKIYLPWAPRFLTPRSRRGH